MVRRSRKVSWKQLSQNDKNMTTVCNRRWPYEKGFTELLVVILPHRGLWDGIYQNSNNGNSHQLQIEWDINKNKKKTFKEGIRYYKKLKRIVIVVFFKTY